MISRTCGSAIGIASVLLAQGLDGVLDQIDIWKAAGELGIAVVFAVSGFMGMGWWIRRKSVEQREDALRMAKRIDNLETFQQTKLLELTGAGVAATVAATDATNENTVQLSRMTDALAGLGSRIATRPCAALEMLPEAERLKVLQLLRGSRTAADVG